MNAPRPSWKPEHTESADLAAGYRAARVLQSLPVPPPLAKQVANYICRADAELTARGISAGSLTETDDAELTR